MRALTSRRVVETLLACAITILFGTAVGMMTSSSPLLGVVAGVGLAGMLVFLVVPDKRVLCLVAWVLIQPLSIEKILYTAVPIWQGLRGYEIVLNAADLVLVLLAAVLLFERRIDAQPRFVFDRRTKLFLMLLVWGAMSYLIHLVIYQDPFVASGPLGVLHLARNLAFVVVVGSAIRTRSDLLWLTFAAMAMLFFESGIVYLSYATGEDYNFARVLGLTTVGLQTYSGDGQSLVRGSGTLGVANQQALFQVMFALLMCGLLVVRNRWVRAAASLAIGLSMAAIVLTFSRTAWLSSMVATAIVLGFVIKRRELPQRAWLVGAFLMMGFIAVLGVFAQPVIDRITRGDDGATGSRIRMIVLAQDLIERNPIIGVGPSEYAEAGLELYPPGSTEPVWLAPGEKPIVPPLGRIELAQANIPGYGEISVPLSVHNKYLLTLSELGIVGLVLWLLIFFEFIRDALRCSRARDPFLRYLGVAGVAICAVALIHMTLDLFADDKTLQELLFPLVLIGAAARVVRKSERDPDETRSRPRGAIVPRGLRRAGSSMGAATSRTGL